jgi:hypothetical protein
MRTTHTIRATFLAIAAGCLCFLPACQLQHSAPPTETRHPALDSRAVNDRLDRLHAGASNADSNAYFDCFAKDAVFLGTDATERWTLDQFKAYCKPYFDQGKGWTYTPHDRHISFDAATNPHIAWFDELLGNDKYGTCRGSGVLVLETAPGTSATLWKIAQYNLSFTIPNAKAAQVTAITNPAK